MTEIIGKIAVLLGIGQEGRKFEKRKRKPGRSRLESDTVTISTEARRLLACGGDVGTEADERAGKMNLNPP